MADALDDHHADEGDAPDHDQGAEEAAEDEFGVRIGPAVQDLDDAVAPVPCAQVEGQEHDADRENHRLRRSHLSEQELRAHRADRRREG